MRNDSVGWEDEHHLAANEGAQIAWLTPDIGSGECGVDRVSTWLQRKSSSMQAQDGELSTRQQTCLTLFNRIYGRTLPASLFFSAESSYIF